MRHFIVFGLALVMSMSIATNAEAKKNKDKGKDKAGAEESAALEMTMTGMASVDDIFTKAQAPLDSINDAQAKIDGVTSGLNAALGLAEGTPFTDAIADLKAKADGKLSVAMDGGVPKVSANDAVPENVTAAIDGFNTAFADAVSAIEKLKDVPGQVQEVIASAKAFDPKTLKPMEIPKATKAITGNIKVLSAAPDQVKALANSVDLLRKEVTSSFAG